MSEDFKEKFINNLYKEIEFLQKRNIELREKIDKATKKLKEGLKELDIRKREEVYIEQYLEETIDLLKGDKE